MGSIADVIAYLEYGRSSLLKSIEGLSKREMTEIPVYGGWTIKEVLAHVIGWDQRVVEVLPLVVQDRADEIPDVEVEAHNQQSIAAWREKSWAEVWAAIQSTHQQVLNGIAALDHIEIDKRHERKGRIITIRTYIINIMIEHQREHADEIEQWRKDLDEAIDPEAVRALVRQSRDAFMTILDKFDEADVLDKSAAGVWSISNVVAHIADWERLALEAAHHIKDSSQPPVQLAFDNTEDWNMALAAERANKSWQENYHYLRQTYLATEDFMATLGPDEWKLRGPYPWFDQGTLAELLIQTAEHYTDHLPDLERWYEERHGEPKT